MTARRLTVPLDWPFSEEFTAELNAWLSPQPREPLRDAPGDRGRARTITLRFVAVEPSGRVAVLKQISVRPRANLEDELRQMLARWST